jgi:hypothetical protein
LVIQGVIRIPARIANLPVHRKIVGDPGEHQDVFEVVPHFHEVGNANYLLISDEIGRLDALGVATDAEILGRDTVHPSVRH